MRYEDSVIDQVQSANDIADVIGQYLKLKRSGRNFKANCPFHQEKTPSFMVNAEKQIFHCFGCGAGGNVFSFLMRHENMSFPEALRHLAEKVHIRLPEPSGRTSEGPSEKEQFYAVYEEAAKYYHAELHRHQTHRLHLQRTTIHGHPRRQHTSSHQRPPRPLRRPQSRPCNRKHGRPRHPRRPRNSKTIESKLDTRDLRYRRLLIDLSMKPTSAPPVYVETPSSSHDSW